MAFSETFLQDLKYRADMVTVASRYVNLRKSGRGYVGLCPFHSEKTPSFNIFSENQSFYCFGCGAGGDVITFIEKIENLDYVDAVKFLAQLVGMEVPEENADDGTTRLRKRIFEINREAAKLYYACLKSPLGLPGLEYFKKRKLSAKTITAFGLGYAPDSWDYLLKHMRSLGYTDEELEKASLITIKNNHSYDKFRNRVMYPIIDLQGNVIAFGGRVLDDSKPKYLNSSDTLVFKKSNNIYALNFAKSAEHKTLILCEGYMDVIAMHQAGFKNAIATLGTALTQEQSRLMARYANDIIVSYDADEAGQKAAARAIGLLTAVGLNVRVLHIEGGKDPDEFIKNYGADKFRLMLDKCGNHIEYRLANVKAKYDLGIADQKVKCIKELETVLATVESSIEREVYTGKVAEEMDLKKDNLLADIERKAKALKGSHKKAEIREQINTTRGMKDKINPEKGRYLRAAIAEETLIVILYKNPDFFKELDGLITPEDFLTDFNRRVYEKELQIIRDGLTLDLGSFAKDFTSQETGKITSMIIMRVVSNTIEEARDCVEVIKQEKLLRQDSSVDALDKLNNIKQKKMQEINNRREL